jgi:exodeoxyribonuclease V alpha subunit
MRRHNLPLTATTIHTGLGVCGHSTGKAEFKHDEDDPLDCEVLVVDEVSMEDTDLMASMLRAVPEGGNVLLIGDQNQLPPVGHGAPLRDMLAAGVPCATLTEIQRNAGDIVRACHAIKDGSLFETSPRLDLDAVPPRNLKHVQADTPEEQAARIMDLLNGARARGFKPMRDVQVLVPRNDGAFVGRQALNVALQAYLNPETETEERRRNPRFRKEDKVICLKNTVMQAYAQKTMADPRDMDSYLHGGDGQLQYIANGDIGKVVATGPDAVMVKFYGPERLVKFDTKRRRKGADEPDGAEDKKPNFDLAYAITTHKSQGSQWPAVVVVLDESAGRLANRELLYTAISRAERVCFLVGKIVSAYKMVQRQQLVRRKTFLGELLLEGCHP